MKRLVFALPAAIVTMAVLLASPAQAQDAKKARGKVTAISATSVSVDAAGVPMTFAIDSKTRVEAPGGSTATRRAEAQGKPGVAITELIKSGDAIEVSYTEAAGKMQASSIRKVTSVGAATTTGGSKSATTTGEAKSATAGASKTASGKVTAVTATSLTITPSSGAAQTYTIDPTTRVIGKGAGTLTAKKGGKVSVTELVGSGDSVSVSFADMNGAMHAKEIRVTTKAVK